MRTPKNIGGAGALGLVALVATLGLAAAPGWAQEAHEAVAGGAHEGAETQAHEAHGEHEGHGEHPKNALALFLGGTRETAEHETFFTIGGEYERQLADRWGVQLVVEHVNDFDAWVAIVPVGFRVVDKLWITAGPGLETEPRKPAHAVEGHQGDEHAGAGDEDSEGPFFLWRFGVNYNIHLNERWGLMPSFNLDLVREHGEWAEAWVFGVSLAYHF